MIKCVTTLVGKKIMPIHYNRIKQALKEKGIMQRWLSEQTGIDRSQISRFCTNKSQPNLEQLFQIAKALQVQPCDLLGDGEDDTNE